MNDGIRFATIEGTENAKGYGQLILGNRIIAGTAKNKRGTIKLYDDAQLRY